MNRTRITVPRCWMGAARNLVELAERKVTMRMGETDGLDVLRQDDFAEIE